MTSSPKFIMPTADPESAGIDPDRLARLDALIESHIAEGRYPGAQIAVARGGKLLKTATFGNARVHPEPVPADASATWLMFSQTKVIIAAALWKLAEDGALRFADRVSDHIPEFAANGKGEITLFQTLTHQGGFPNAEVPEEAWRDRDLLRRAVCDFSLEWTPGSRIHYHPLSAHWVAAALIEAVIDGDFREYIRRELLTPLGLDDDIFIGVGEDDDHRCADMHQLDEESCAVIRAPLDTRAWRAAGVPGGGAYATARGMAALYQTILAGGALNGTRVLGPRVIQYATRNHTANRVDESMGMPMHRGIGPHIRGCTPTIRGLGTIASPTTFGHGGAGTSYSWGDPESGVSFTYVSNQMSPEPWHTVRLDKVSNIVHASIVE